MRKQILLPLILFGCGIAFAESISSQAINSGSLNARIQNGGIVSSLGDAFSGTLSAEGYSITCGFQQVPSVAIGPVQLLLISHPQTSSWEQLFATGRSIQLRGINGRVMNDFPMGVSKEEIVAYLDQLPVSPYILSSGDGSHPVRLIVSPTLLRH